MNLARFLAGRLATGIVVLWAAATLTFLMMQLTGGDVAVAILGGPDAMPTAEQLARVRVEYGLDKPLVAQYGEWLWKLLHGDLGQSYRLRIPVADAIGEQVGSTITLTVVSAVLSVAIAIVLALLTARRRNAWIGRISSGVELVLISIPVFVIGIGLLLAFAFYLPILPVANAPGVAGLVLPVLTICLVISPMLTQILRQELEEVLEQPFILTARARGLSEAGTRVGHALRHAIGPIVTLSGFMFAAMISGAAVTETLFSRPGIGRLMVEAAAATDIPVVIGVTVLSALFYVIASTAVDLVGALVDPRTVA